MEILEYILGDSGRFARFLFGLVVGGWVLVEMLKAVTDAFVRLATLLIKDTPIPGPRVVWPEDSEGREED